jgi:hypothetical protein
VRQPFHIVALTFLTLSLPTGRAAAQWAVEVATPATPIVNQPWQQPGTILYDTGNVMPGLPHMPWGSPPLCEDALPKCGCDLQVMAGAYFSHVGLGPSHPTYNFAPLALRFGKMTECGWTEGWLRGNFEPMLEFSGAGVFNGFGNFYVGSSALLRYNFIQPDARLIPYFQIGAGVSYNDGYRDPTQAALGQGMEFLVQAQLGVRYFLTQRCSIDIEAGYIHISNAHMADRNLGINALGGSIGISYFFGGPRRPERW